MAVRLPGGLLVVLALASFGALSPREVTSADQLLEDAGFEAGSVGWHVTGAVATSVTAPAVSGKALRVEGGDGLEVSQMVPVTPGATYLASISVAASSGVGAVTLRLRFLDATFQPANNNPGSTVMLQTTFTLVTAGGTAEDDAAWVQFQLSADPFAGQTLAVVLDEATLVEVAPAATPTPASTPTAPAASVTAAATPSATTTTGTPTAAATRTATVPRPPTATRTATPTKTPTATRTPTPTKTPAATRTPTPRPTPTATRAPLPRDGGMLANGGFEALEDGQPAGWSKVGGDFVADSDAFEGAWAAALTSDTSSTKWVHQFVAVEPGAWYEVDAHGRIAEGAGEVWVRLSWYASPVGAGEALETADGPLSSGEDWTSLATGPVQAPEGARSVRVRLMYRPAGPGKAAFDSVSLWPSSPPPATPTQTVPAATGTATGSQGTAIPGGSTGAATARTTTQAATGRQPGTAGPAIPLPISGPLATGPESLRLSEAMSDPTEQPDSAYEWVEIVNTGTESVSTAGWKLGNARELDDLPAVTIEPGGFAVVAGKLAAFPDGVLVLRLADGTVGGGLRNTGDVVHLVAPSGEEVDAMSYGDRPDIFDPAVPAAQAGSTLGVRAPGADAGAENWAETEVPTPGSPNRFAGPPAGGGTAAPGQAPGAGQAQGRPEEAALVSGSEGSTVPWILLSVAAAVGGGGLAVGLQRGLSRISRRGET